MYPETILHTSGIYGWLEFSRDGKYLIAASDQGAERWDANTWTKIGNVGDKSQKLISASFNGWAPDRAKQRQASGKVDRIVTTDTNGIVQVWTLDNKLLMKFPGSNLQHSFFADCTTPEAVRKLTASELQSLKRPVYARFSPDDAAVIVAYENGILVMVNSESGGCLDVYNPHSKHEAVFSPDGEWVASLQDSHARSAVITMFHVQDWKLTSYELPTYTLSPSLLALSVNQVVMIDSGVSTILFDCRNPTHPLVLSQPPAVVNDLSWDGNYLAEASQSEAMVGSAQSRMFAELRGHSGSIQYITFDPNSTHVLSTSDDKTVHIWPVKKNPLSPLASWQDIVHYLRNFTKVCFTPEERMKLLNESQDAANKNAGQCEASHK
jgi:WD40 repeat protein